jgi:c(7)-type cytochrome triheme protein
MPKRTIFNWRAVVVVRVYVVVGVLAGLRSEPAHAEYGDIVINNYSDAAGMRPPVFPHWFHRIRFRCKVCHGDLGFQFKAGGNDITMLKIFDGQFCGACHNGQIAWSVENCTLCHSGKPGTKTQVHNSTTDRLVTPPDKAGQNGQTFTSAPKQ